MATLLTLRRKIKAAQNISKTTRAMQMIAASKLKGAQDAALSSRPYVEKLTAITQEVTFKTSDEKKHPYMILNTDTTKTLLIVLSPDKGSCGPLVTNLLKEFLSYAQNEKDSSFIVVGKKAENKVIKLENEVLATFHFGTTRPTFDMVFPIIKLIDEYYLSGKVQSVKVLFTDFKSFFHQAPTITQLLPISLPDAEDVKINNTDSLYEPSLEEMIPSLLKQYLEMSLFQLYLESFLSEQAARMIAMQNATNNAKDIIEDLKLEYNKTRQAKITSELLDITGGRTQVEAE